MRGDVGVLCGVLMDLIQREPDADYATRFVFLYALALNPKHTMVLSCDRTAGLGMPLSQKACERVFEKKVLAEVLSDLAQINAIDCDDWWLIPFTKLRPGPRFEHVRDWFPAIGTQYIDAIFAAEARRCELIQSVES